jgi:hypothetical protein
MLIKFAFVGTVLLWPVVTCATDYTNTEEVAKVSAIVKQGKFEHVLRELERQAAVAKYSCKRYYDNYEQDLVVRSNETLISMQVIRCFHKDASSGAVWVNVSTPPNEVTVVLYGVEGSQENLTQGKEFLRRFASSLQADPVVENVCVLAPAPTEHTCKPP